MIQSRCKLITSCIIFTSTQSKVILFCWWLNWGWIFFIQVHTFAIICGWYLSWILMRFCWSNKPGCIGRWNAWKGTCLVLLKLRAMKPLSLFLGIDAKKFALSSSWTWTWKCIKKPPLFGLLFYTRCVNRNGSWDEVRKPSRFCGSCQDLLWAHQPKAGSVRAVSRHPKWPSPRPWLPEAFLHLMMI